MTVPTADHRPPRAARPGLRRGSLTPERIVDASLELLDKQGVAGFSLPKLGRVLGADPTAVYRHFASKDDLVLAIADRLIAESMAGMEPRACWVDTVIEGTRRLRAVYRALGDFALYFAGGAADFLALDERAQAADRATWTRAYLAVDRAEFPHIWQVRLELPEVIEDEIFDTILSLVIGGLIQQAPRPCGCGAHPAYPADPA